MFFHRSRTGKGTVGSVFHYFHLFSFGLLLAATQNYESEEK